MIRSSSCGSLVTDLPPVVKRKPSPDSSACPAYCMCRRRNRSRSANVCRPEEWSPLSRREMSSIALNERSRSSTARMKWRTSASSGVCCKRFCSVAANSPSACTGWRRSWLAMATKRLFSWSLRRALSRSASSSRVRAATTSAWRSWRYQLRCPSQATASVAPAPSNPVTAHGQAISSGRLAAAPRPAASGSSATPVATRRQGARAWAVATDQTRAAAARGWRSAGSASHGSSARLRQPRPTAAGQGD